jgi:CRISPR/Cas system-associated exonuclease Cas4 (RecB family)
MQAGTPAKFVRNQFGKRKSKLAAKTRELLYTYAYRQKHPGQNIELHSHNLSTGEMVPITMTAKKEQSLYEALEKTLISMERDEYPALPAEPNRCPTCPFFLICPA